MIRDFIYHLLFANLTNFILTGVFKSDINQALCLVNKESRSWKASTSFLTIALCTLWYRSLKGLQRWDPKNCIHLKYKIITNKLSSLIICFFSTHSIDNNQSLSTFCHWTGSLKWREQCKDWFWIETAWAITYLAMSRDDFKKNNFWLN